MAKRGQPSQVVVPGNMLRIVNTGTTKFKARYRGQWVTLPPNVEAFIEYGAAIAWLGNPFLRDTPRDKERTREFHRIKLMHMGAEHVHNDGEWPESRPKLECYTLEGARFYTVADDPKGTSIVDLSNDNDPARLNAQFAQMHGVLQAMAAKLEEAGISAPVIPDINAFAPTPTVTDDPNRKGSLNAPIVLGPDNPLDEDVLEDEDEYGSDDLIPADDGGIRKVTEVPIDDSKRIIRVSSGTER